MLILQFRHMWNIKRTLKNKTRKETQINFYKVIAVPTYYHETWVLNQEDCSSLTATEMVHLRSVKGRTIQLIATVTVGENSH